MFLNTDSVFYSISVESLDPEGWSNDAEIQLHHMKIS